MNLTFLGAALGHAARGRPVLPLWPTDGVNCACSKGGTCPSPGKHPLGTLVPHGLTDATTDAATIRAWWRQVPHANVGLVTGAASGLVVLDTDPRHGGDATLAALEAVHGQLPATGRVETGGGGLHIYFEHPGGTIRNSAGTTLGAGLDVRGDGGYVAVPPSRHASGREYRHASPAETPLAPLPAWLLDRLRGSARPTPSRAASEPIPEGQRNTTLASLAGAMRRKCMSPDALTAALLAENTARCQPPLAEREVRAIAASIARYPTAPLTLRTDTAASAFSASPDTTPAVRAWPTPLGEAAFYGLAGEYVRLVEEHTEADPVALLGQFLVAIGNLIDRGAHFEAEGARHYANLFAAFVGMTAKGRKGSSWAQVKARLHSIDAEWSTARVLSGLSSGEGLIWAVRDPITTRSPIREKGRVVGYEDIESDPGVSDKRLLVVEPELASTLRVMARDGNTLSATVRQAWDSGDLRVLTKNSAAVASGAHISIVAHVTKDELTRYLDRTEAGNGFANRIIWLCVRRARSLPEGGKLSSVDFAPYLAQLRAAVDFARKLGHRELPRDAEARALWRDVYDDLAEGRPGMLGAVTGRAEPQVMRLALVYALLDEADAIRRPHLEAALELWRYSFDSAKFVFGDALGDPVADEIMVALRRAGPAGLRRDQLRDLFHRNRRSDEIARALALLAEQGRATMTREETGGRPAERWRALTTDYAENAQDAQRGATREGDTAITAYTASAGTAQGTAPEPGAFDRREPDRMPDEAVIP